MMLKIIDMGGNIAGMMISMRGEHVVLIGRSIISHHTVTLDMLRMRRKINNHGELKSKMRHVILGLLDVTSLMLIILNKLRFNVLLTTLQTFWSIMIVRVVEGRLQVR